MAAVIKGRWLDGHTVRRCRVQVQCNDYRHCRTTINSNDFYAELEMDPDLAGGFGMKKLCMNCAGPEAQAAVAELTHSKRWTRIGSGVR
jgi:hypothetical protein